MNPAAAGGRIRGGSAWGRRRRPGNESEGTRRGTPARAGSRRGMGEARGRGGALAGAVGAGAHEAGPRAPRNRREAEAVIQEKVAASWLRGGRRGRDSWDGGGSGLG